MLETNFLIDMGNEYYDLQAEVGIGSFIITVMLIVFTLQTSHYHYNQDFPCELFTLSLWNGFLATSNLFKTELCIHELHCQLKIPYHKYVSQYVNIILNWQDWCLFLRKHEVIILTIFRIHTSWQWFIIVHDNTSPLNIFGELYCKG